MTYIERSVHIQDVRTENKWTFVLDMMLPFFVAVRFIPREQIRQQTHNIDAFHQPSVSNADCIIGLEKYADAGVIF